MSDAMREIRSAAFPPQLRLPRGVLKTLSYSLMHLSVAMSVAYLLTGSWKAALAIGLIEPAVQTLAYTFHERAWVRAGAAQGGSPACGHRYRCAPQT
ncbi:hypothetical protein GCM10011367_19780 [Marinicauda pacifica]|nr:DUF2061 domain-containing protein [Marinicauda pacifica]GGE45047.1 hypothetical protein GCM10011367_19780 [Marinicauda pacifica]